MSKSDKSDNGLNDLEQAQLALVRFQQKAMESGAKVLIIFEGRDAAGKDGTIKRLTEHLSVRATRVVALPKPSDRERSQWYFQRYVPYLPAAGELVIFNRSWYNRGGVEPVMGFCTPEEHETFLRDVSAFEAMLVESGVNIVKLWLDVSKKEQAKRLAERHSDPLKVLKSSPLDEAAQSRWDDYTTARDEMLKRTHAAPSPWVCVRNDDKDAGRLNVMRHIVNAIAPKEIAKQIKNPDPEIVFPFVIEALTDGRLER
ncbi:polyphosphate kinase 2 [Phenylobacterium ferrooxidans]|uniref:ADP/GDP-polyphosphate phosphotransferase n=1 Tax=Phenylobacterium ferrooxidans TaxID=2982689 RepID=A0ABW6CTL8_9CAUL